MGFASENEKFSNIEKYRHEDFPDAENYRR